MPSTSYSELLFYLENIDPEDAECAQMLENVKGMMELLTDLTVTQRQDLRVRIYLVDHAARRVRGQV